MDPVIRTCKTCHIEKPIEDFSPHGGGVNGYRHECKQCRSDYTNARQKAKYVPGPQPSWARAKVIREKEIVPQGLIRRCNVCNLQKPLELFRGSRMQKYGRAYICKACDSNIVGALHKTPKGRADCNRRQRKFLAARRKDPIWQFRKRLSTRLRHSFNSLGLKKASTTDKLLGYNALALWQHLKVFLDKPCGWCGVILTLKLDELAIDHIVPISSGKTEQEIITLNALENLRLIHGVCNAQKHAKRAISKFDLAEWKL